MGAALEVLACLFGMGYKNSSSSGSQDEVTYKQAVVDSLVFAIPKLVTADASYHHRIRFSLAAHEYIKLRLLTGQSEANNDLIDGYWKIMWEEAVI